MRVCDAENGNRAGRREHTSPVRGMRSGFEGRIMRKDDSWKLSDRDAQCPFFRDHTRKSVGCESPFPGAVTRTKWEDEEDKTTQYDAFCCGKYQNCELYRLIMESYDDG